jgi:hypothetical protein
MDLKSIPKTSLLGLAGLAVIIVITWLPITDTIADADVDKGFNRALASFAIAKGLNMVISVLQSTQFSAQPLGFGIAMSPGELLDPINDLVEQFSNVMLLATVAFGIQKVLIAIGGHALVKTLLSALGIAAAWLLYKDRPVPHWLKNAFILIVLVRLAVPAATVMSNGAYQIFLEPQYEASTAALNESSLQLEALKSSTQKPLSSESEPESESEAAPQPEAAPQAQALEGQPQVAEPAKVSWWTKVKTSFSNVKASISNAVHVKPFDFIDRVNTKIHGMSQRIQALGEELTRNIVNQIVVFLLQTLVFPIGLIWVLYKIGASMMYRSKK